MSSYNFEVEALTPQNVSYLRNKHCLVFNNSNKVMYRPKAVKLQKNERGVYKKWQFTIRYPNGSKELITEENGDWRIAR